MLPDNSSCCDARFSVTSTSSTSQFTRPLSNSPYARCTLSNDCWLCCCMVDILASSCSIFSWRNKVFCSRTAFWLLPSPALSNSCSSCSFCVFSRFCPCTNRKPLAPSPSKDSTSAPTANPLPPDAFCSITMGAEVGAGAAEEAACTSSAGTAADSFSLVVVGVFSAFSSGFWGCCASVMGGSPCKRLGHCRVRRRPDSGKPTLWPHRIAVMFGQYVHDGLSIARI